MKRLDLFNCIFLSLIGFLSRVFLVERIQSHWDGPQFSIAILRYSFEQQTPAPPGYPFYIGLGKFFNLFLNNPHQSLLLISILEAAIGAVIVYLIVKTLFNIYVGLLASVIFLTGSTFYYFSLTAYGYGLVTITTLSLAYVSYLIFIKKKQKGILLGLLFGISIGFRPQEIVGTFLLFLLGFILLRNREKVKSLAALLIITLVWLVPSFYANGIIGFFKYTIEFSKNAFPPSSISQHLSLMIKGYLLSFGLAAISPIYFIYMYIRLGNKYFKNNYKIVILYSCWIIPSLLFNLLIRSDHAGYQLSYLSAFLVIDSYIIWLITKKNKLLYFLIVFIIAVFNLYWFFYNRDPNFVKPYRITSFHYSDIRKNDLKTGSKISFVKTVFKPQNTLIVTDSVLWRPYMYHLKDYLVVSLDGIADNNPQSYYYQRIGENWQAKQFKNKLLEFKIPKNIKTVLLVDDENYKWVKNLQFKTYKFPGNSVVTSIPVKEGEKIVYKFHYLTVSNGF
jgi:hypothetical protein